MLATSHLHARGAWRSHRQTTRSELRLRFPRSQLRKERPASRLPGAAPAALRQSCTPDDLKGRSRTWSASRRALPPSSAPRTRRRTGRGRASTRLREKVKNGGRAKEAQRSGGSRSPAGRSPGGDCHHAKSLSTLAAAAYAPAACSKRPALCTSHSLWEGAGRHTSTIASKKAGASSWRCPCVPPSTVTAKATWKTVGLQPTAFAWRCMDAADARFESGDGPLEVRVGWRDGHVGDRRGERTRVHLRRQRRRRREADLERRAAAGHELQRRGAVGVAARGDLDGVRRRRGAAGPPTEAEAARRRRGLARHLAAAAVHHSGGGAGDGPLGGSVDHLARRRAPRISRRGASCASRLWGSRSPSRRRRPPTERRSSRGGRAGPTPPTARRSCSAARSQRTSRSLALRRRRTARPTARASRRRERVAPTPVTSR